MKLIVFDCDGTLADSQHMIVEAMKAAFSASGVTAPERAHVLRHVGLSVTEAMAAMTGLTDAGALDRLSVDYRTAFAALRRDARFADPLFPGARQALKRLAEHDGVILGIATGKSRRGVALLLEREGLTGVFATIQTADDAPSKPHPAMLLQAMDAVGAAAGETVMIGDTSFDMEMARSAGATAIGVAWGYHPAEDLRAAGAAAVLRHPTELIDCLQSLSAHR
jgi:phosphoglycolate phosphatase